MAQTLAEFLKEFEAVPPPASAGGWSTDDAYDAGFADGYNKALELAAELHKKEK